MKTISGKALSLLAPMVLLGCGTMPLGAGKVLAQPAAQSQSSMDSQLMYELMIAELAGRRGQLDVAMAGYLSASKRTDDPRVSERATRLALFGRQWEEAEEVARRWITLDPDNTEAPQLLGQTLLRQDKADAAVELFTELLSGADDRRQMLQSIQFELQSNENPATSVAVMQQLSDAFSNEPEAYLGLARASIINADSPAALKATEAALAIAPEDTDALLLQAQILNSQDKQEEAFTSLLNAVQRYPENIELRLGYVRLLVAADRHDDVPKQLATISAQSNDTEHLLAIGLLALESEHIEQAQEYLSELRSSGAYSDQASFYLARISDDQRDYEQAISYYDEVGQGELYFNAQVRAAELTALGGELNQSRSRLQQLALRVPDPVLQPRLVAAESRILQNADLFLEAVTVLSEGLEKFPDNTDLLYARALASDNAGNSQSMIDDLTRMIELDPENAHALNALGYHYADENIELERAEELLVKANTLLPDDPAIMDSLGWLRFRQGNFAEAITWLRNAYEQFPDPEIAAHLGEALWRSGAQQEARDLVEKALLSDPDDERLLAVRENTFK